MLHRSRFEKQLHWNGLEISLKIIHVVRVMYHLVVKQHHCHIQISHYHWHQEGQKTRPQLIVEKGSMSERQNYQPNQRCIETQIVCKPKTSSKSKFTIVEENDIALCHASMGIWDIRKQGSYCDVLRLQYNSLSSLLLIISLYQGCESTEAICTKRD